MSASLVGSEMCIRDRPFPPPPDTPRGDDEAAARLPPATRLERESEGSAGARSEAPHGEQGGEA
eukprot:5015102-Alexandrium_andersonii.AAC.1